MENFFIELLNLEKEGNLNVESVLDFVSNYDMDEEAKKIILKRISEHKYCEHEIMNEKSVDPEYEGEALTVARYGEYNYSLECEYCNEIVIDLDVLEEMIG